MRGESKHRRFLVYSRGGQFGIAGIMCMVVVNKLVPWAANGYETWQTSPVGGVVVVGTVLFVARWLLVGGLVTVDDARRRIERRRWWRRGAISNGWGFDDVVDSRVARKGKDEVVWVRFSDGRRLAFVCKRGAGDGVLAAITGPEEGR